MSRFEVGKTRNGFMPGDRVRHESGWCGTVLYTRHAPPGYEWVQSGGGGVCSGHTRVTNLILLSDDTGDPPKTVRRGPLGDLSQRSHVIALQKGFYADLYYARCCVDDPKVLAFIERLWLLARCSLIHSEVSEMVEAIRDGALAEGAAHNGKPEGLPSEMADVLIRLADLAGAQGVDIDKAVAEKMSYNATREHMHGRGA